MFEGIPLSVWLVIAGLIAHAVTFIVVGTRWVSNLETSIRESFRAEMKAERTEIDHHIGILENETRQAIAGLQADSRQSVASMHNLLGTEIKLVGDALHEHEKFTRDTFVRRESFRIIVDQFIAQIKEISTAINERLNRLDEKLDRIHGTKS